MIAEFQITSLQDLLEYLPTASPDEYRSIAEDMSLSISDFKQYESWKKERYTRNCIVRTDAYELILLCWDKGHETAIHCHGGEECWVYNAQGKIEEKNYRLEGSVPVQVHSEVLQTGEVSYMNDDLGFHKLANLADGRSMSLHLYMNPINNCNMWSNLEQRFIPVDLKYDTLAGKPL